MIPLRDSQPSRSFPLVTLCLIVVNVAVFLHEFSLDHYSLNRFVEEYGLIPKHFQLPALFTSMFLHGGWMHLIGNMWFLWIFGDNVEDILGRAKYLLFYIGSGVAATLSHLVVSSDSNAPLVGASGAIAGVMGAYVLKFPHSRITTLIPIIIFFTTADLPAWIMLIYWFGIQILSGFGELASAPGQQGGVAWFAHVGGFLAGMALINLLRPRDRYRARVEYYW